MNKLSIYTLLCICISVFNSCKYNTNDNKEKTQEIDYVKTTNSPSRPISDLEYLIKYKGDTIAYHELYIAHHDIGFKYFLPFALIMANKYDCSVAYFDVFICLWQIYGGWDEEGDISLDKLDKTTRDMAIDYLKKGVEKGEKNCMRYLGYYYIRGKYVKKDVKYGEYLQEKGRI